MPSNNVNQPLPPVIGEGPTSEPKHQLRLREGYLSSSARRAELILGPTEPFRSLIERYLETVVPKYYKVNTVIQVRSSIGKFFRFVAQELQISDLDQIRPSTITKFIEKEHERGLTAICFIGHISSFFVWLISLELYDRGNPVIARLHRPKMSPHSGSSFPSRNTKAVQPAPHEASSVSV